jgi:hypothetical protein
LLNEIERAVATHAAPVGNETEGDAWR